MLLYVDDTIYSSLVFDLNKDYAIDNEGNLYFQPPIQRGGVIFLPISLIARCFGLLYSTVEVDRGYLVWVRNTDMDLEERYFRRCRPSPGWTMSTTSTCGARAPPPDNPAARRTPPPP